ncbi:hypothetical protein [Sulfitobacter sp.]|uniref:hypothetical protein n=1 Tax=Sulfitobacter sp. TaxID=1903071 RepID=UPI003EF4EADD
MSDSLTISHLPKRNFNAKIHDAFGLDPEWVSLCFVDLGMFNGEIGRYVGLPQMCISTLMRRPDLSRYLDC